MSSSPGRVDGQHFRDALGAFTTGVTIVTTRDAAGTDIGLTANSFNSVSLDPPMVLWSLSKSSMSLGAFVESQHFAVHILAADQEPLSNLFAKRGADKFAGLCLSRGHGGIPLLDGCAARFECRTAFRYEGGDHEIFVGEVITFEHFPRPPLVFHAGSYAVALRRPSSASPLPPSIPDSSFSRGSLSHLLATAHFQIGLKLRPQTERMGLSEAAVYVLSILGVDDERSLDELDAVAAVSGQHVTVSTIDRLRERELITLVAHAKESRLHLTDRGRQTIIELLAAAKAAEEDACQDLEHSEVQMLKDLLKRVIRNTGAS